VFIYEGYVDYRYISTSEVRIYLNDLPYSPPIYLLMSNVNNNVIGMYTISLPHYVTEGASEICDDGIDNDGDGRVDCFDPDCALHSACTGGGGIGSAGGITPDGEICNNGVDDNNDGLIDCEDPACNGNMGAGGVCEYGTELTCADFFDNDADGLIDCSDADCVNTPVCGVAGGEICDNGIDDDGDGLIDCEDPDCDLLVGGPNGQVCEYGLEVMCADLFDNDADTLVDCADPDCFALPSCGGGGLEICDDGIDNDGDNRIDCNDPDCIGQIGGPNGELCELPDELTCDDTFDNNANGALDCADATCDGQVGGPNGELCEALTEQTCDDGFDNDGDGLTDCADGNCASNPSCVVPPTPGNTVAVFDLEMPSMDPFVIHGTVPLPAFVSPTSDGSLPFKIQNSDGNSHNSPFGPPI